MQTDRQRGVIYFMHLEQRKHKKVNKKLYKIPTYEIDKNSISQGTIIIYTCKATQDSARRMG